MTVRMSSLSGSVDAIVAAADQAMARRDFPVAAAMIEKAVAAGGRDPTLFLKLAAARRAAGDHTAALDAVQQLLRQHPRHLAGLLMAGSLLTAFGRAEEAAEAFRRALPLIPPGIRLPPAMQDQIERARAHLAADEAWRRRALDALPDTIANRLSPAERLRVEGFQKELARESRGAMGGHAA